MRLNDISKPKTADNLNENLAKRFGQKINIEKFTLEQLQDVRNKIRTKMSQFESNEKYESVLKDSEYQKNKLFLDVLNQAIAEREDISDQETKEASKPDFPDIDGDGNTKEPISQAAKDKKAKGGDKKKKDLSKVPPQLRKHMKGENVEEGISPVPMDGKCPKGYKLSPDGKRCIREKKMDEGKNPTKAHVMKMVKDGKSEKEMMDMHSDADKDKLKAMIKDCKKEMKENKDQGKLIIENYFNSLIEGEEDKAEIVMAAKDMVDRITSWMEDTAEMQAESMLELGDAIRDELGVSQSESYIQTVKPSLESLYAALEVTRGALTSGVAKLTGEEDPAQMMGDEAGAEPAMDADMEPSMDAEEPAAPADDFDASEPAAGGEDEAGRAKRESIELSLKLGQILSSKKK